MLIQGMSNNFSRSLLLAVVPPKRDQDQDPAPKVLTMQVWPVQAGEDDQAQGARG